MEDLIYYDLIETDFPRWSHRQPIKCHYRCDPIPKTACGRWSMKHLFRHPKTTQERRWSYAYGKYVRGRRKACNLPNLYDDICPCFNLALNRKSWKNNRKKKQWM